MAIGGLIIRALGQGNVNLLITRGLTPAAGGALPTTTGNVVPCYEATAGGSVVPCYEVTGDESFMPVRIVTSGGNVVPISIGAFAVGKVPIKVFE